MTLSYVTYPDGNVSHYTQVRNKPHKPVCTNTLARWIKSVLISSGVDTSVFKAHSVRSASTSYAYAKGVPIAEILRAADWTNAGTFKKYYLRRNNS